jgi:hypothetical protein
MKQQEKFVEFAVFVANEGLRPLVPTMLNRQARLPLANQGKKSLA